MGSSQAMLVLGVAACLFACQENQLRPLTPLATSKSSGDVVYLTLSVPRPAAGDTVTVTANVARPVGTKPVGSFKAYLRFDDSGLTFLHQATLSRGARALNPLQGCIIVAGAAAEGFLDDRLFAVTFLLDRTEAIHSLELRIQEMNGTDFASQLPRVQDRIGRIGGVRQ